MAGQLLNVNDEMKHMKKCIGDVYSSTYKIRDIKEASWMYKTNFKINLLTIIATVFMLLGEIIKLNLIMIGIGILIALLSVILLIKTNTLATQESVKISKVCGVLICIIIAASILQMYVNQVMGYMLFYSIVPVIAALINWLVVIVSNFKMKNQIWKISQGI